MTTKKCALVTGQDGTCLSEFLLKKGYVVHGIKRRASSFKIARIAHLSADPHVRHWHFEPRRVDRINSTKSTQQGCERNGQSVNGQFEPSA